MSFKQNLNQRIYAGRLAQNSDVPFSSKGDKVKTVEQYSSCAKAINHQKPSKERCSFLFKKQIDGEYQKDFQREKRLTGFSQLSKCLKNALGNV